MRDTDMEEEVKYYTIPRGAIKETALHFGCNERTVRRALSGETKSVLGVKIRRYVMEHYDMEEL